jgi:hypothetical protein
MLLTKIILENFRGICDPKEVKFNNFNIFVGQNDSGKSTVLKALDLFLNNSEAIEDMLNVKSATKLVSITLYFLPDKSTIIIDESISTTFQDEELLDSNGLLCLKKVWDVTKGKITPDTFIIRKRYDSDDFLLASEKDLVKLCKSNKIDTHKANNEEYNNVEKRGKLRETHKQKNTSFSFIEEKLATSGTGRSKLIFDAVKTVLPRLEYFKADTSLSETDTVIQNYFRQLALKTIKEVGASSVEENVNRSLSQVLSKITDKINKVVTSEENVEPEIIFDWSKLVQISFKSQHGENNIPLKLRGDGFRRITMMAYFEYLAEQNNSENQNMIFGFEEPETFLHPSLQENLFEKLFAMTENSYQVIITTHSPIIVSNSPIKNISHVVKLDNLVNFCQDIKDFSGIIKDLGITVENQFISEFDRAKALFLVEGIDDVKALHYAAETYKNNKVIDKSFKDLDLAIIMVGGCGSIKHWVATELLKTLNKPFFILQDSDKISIDDPSPNRAALLELGFKECTDFLVTRKRTLENYIHCKALNRIVPEACINYGDFDNVSKMCGQNNYAGKLGGKNVLDKHFCKLTFDELKASFTYNDSNDEFIDIYNAVKIKLN